MKSFKNTLNKHIYLNNFMRADHIRKSTSKEWLAKLSNWYVVLLKPLYSFYYHGKEKPGIKVRYFNS